jgi:hypothetical protein
MHPLGDGVGDGNVPVLGLRGLSERFFREPPLAPLTAARAELQAAAKITHQQHPAPSTIAVALGNLAA